MRRAVQDYERAAKKKAQSGEEAELAVMRYERDKLNNDGHPELAGLIKQVSKESGDYGYFIYVIIIFLSMIHLKNYISKSNLQRFPEAIWNSLFRKMNCKNSETTQHTESTVYINTAVNTNCML